jgi:hypothetical protein
MTFSQQEVFASAPAALVHFQSSGRRQPQLQSSITGL